MRYIMIKADEGLTAPLSLPATPRVLAQSVGSGFVPCVYEDGRIERLVRKAKATPEAALRYAERRLYFSQLRTNEARRRLAAISDPFWLRLLADMGLRQKAVHTSVNRDRTGFDGWR
jgi:uncharacterized protein YjiS (DUF1127 family)